MIKYFIKENYLSYAVVSLEIRKKTTLPNAYTFAFPTPSSFTDVFTIY